MCEKCDASIVSSLNLDPALFSASKIAQGREHRPSVLDRGGRIASVARASYIDGAIAGAQLAVDRGEAAINADPVVAALSRFVEIIISPEHADDIDEFLRIVRANNSTYSKQPAVTVRDAVDHILSQTADA